MIDSTIQQTDLQPTGGRELMPYWFVDTEENLYLGTKGELFTDTDAQIALVRAAMIDAQMDWKIGRTMLTETPPANPKLRDMLEPVRDGLTALTMLEEGKL